MSAHAFDLKVFFTVVIKQPFDLEGGQVSAVATDPEVRAAGRRPRGRYVAVGDTGAARPWAGNAAEAFALPALPAAGVHNGRAPRRQVLTKASAVEVVAPRGPATAAPNPSTIKTWTGIVRLIE
ncbi:hypothetical protein [Micromonospora peucetia]|uniref:Uncharacterized protein n=1 Tax=Micromonospora peucetia TaxID=47871 RepID=A0ABZ1EDE6_9ACTN|nr:hypothetical protein [Micromonospora peucetia]WSA32549.1 hypothetical protein OIE14_00115 [Micromonospora peucetia]